MKKRILTGVLIFLIVVFNGMGIFADSITYTYDDENRLIKEIMVNGNEKTTVYYFYDENGNLISKVSEIIKAKTGNEVVIFGIILK